MFLGTEPKFKPCEVSCIRSGPRLYFASIRGGNGPVFEKTHLVYFYAFKSILVSLSALESIII